MDIPVEAAPYAYGGWPANELEQVLAAAVEGGAPSAGARIAEVLGRSPVWVPLPNGGGPRHPSLDLPTLELDGQAYVPVFSSEQQFRQIAGEHMPYAVAPAVEFARGLPPQLGIVVNPEGAVGVPLPPAAVAELCRAGRTELDGTGGGRVRLFLPDWQDDPLDFLAVAREEFTATGVVTTARRCLASVEGGPDQLFIGVQTDRWENEALELPMAALGRALGRVPVRWEVNLILLDVARDPVTDWLLARVSPFYARDTHAAP